MRRTGPKPSDIIENEILQERRDLLRDLLESRPWTEVVRPAIGLKMQRIARLLATDTSRSIEETRLLQGRYRSLAEMVNLSVDDVNLLFAEE